MAELTEQIRLYEPHRRQPRIAAIGGGHGLSAMLRGLKTYTKNITAIVTVADDGGGSGMLREDLGMLPPGDIRNCIMALANTEPTMQQLLNYRFTDGSLAGQSFGNLFLAAMNGISGSFDEAVHRMGDVLAITGRVLPVTNQDVGWRRSFTTAVACSVRARSSTRKRSTIPASARSGWSRSVRRPCRRACRPSATPISS